MGLAVSTLAANGLACESSKTMEEESGSRRSARWQKLSTAPAARHCHPREVELKFNIRELEPGRWLENKTNCGEGGTSVAERLKGSRH